MKQFVSKLLSILFLFHFIACKKDDVEPEEQGVNDDHVTILNENSGWNTFAYSEDAFLGSSAFFHITTLPFDFRIHLGIVEQNNPSFFSSWRFNSQDVFDRPYQAKMLYENDKRMVAIDAPFSMATAQDLGKENRGVSGGIPYNLSNKLDRGFSYINRFFIHDGDVYASSNSWRKVFNSWRNHFNVKTILNSSGTRYGWFTAAHKRIFPASIDFSGNPLYKEVAFNEVGTPDLMKSGSDLKIMSVGKFHDYEANGTTNHRACLLEKNWNTLTDSIDQVYPLPFDQSIHSENISTNTYCNNGKILSAINVSPSGKTMLAYGDRTNGLRFIKTYQSIDIFEVVKSSNAIFCVYRDSSQTYHAFKVTTNGAIEDYFNIPVGTYSHFQGDLIVGESVNNSITVSQITSAGTQVLGSENITKNASNITFASDGMNLYAALRNCVSPVYSGGAGQFCGYEIVKFNQ